MALPRITNIAHHLVGSIVRKGDHVVDATAGNGHDTLFLADLVGPEGKVDSFDIQDEAIAATRRRTAGYPQVCLHQISHTDMRTRINGQVRAVMFNLGFLPSGDKSVITKPDSTLAALEDSRFLIEGDGILSVIVYPSHHGGSEEAICVDGWFSRLPSEEFKVWRCGDWPPPVPGNCPKNPAPYLLAAVRRR